MAEQIWRTALFKINRIRLKLFTRRISGSLKQMTPYFSTETNDSCFSSTRTKHQIVMKFWHLTFECWYYPEIIWIWQQWYHLYVRPETYWVMCYVTVKLYKNITSYIKQLLKLFILHIFLLCSIRSYIYNIYHE